MDDLRQATAPQVAALPFRNSLSSPLARDALFLTSFYLGGIVLCWWLAPPFYIANFVLLAAPMAYLFVRSARARANISPGFTGLFMFFTLVVVVYLAELYGGWISATSFPFRFPGGVTVEELQWVSFYFALVLAINEHFFATTARSRPRPVAMVLLTSAFFAGLLVALSPALHAYLAEYVYLKLGLLFVVPFTLLGLWVNPGILRQLLLTGIVSAALTLLYELLGLKYGYWEFHGDYVGMVDIAGFVFPIEEFVFFLLLSGPSIVATHAIYGNFMQLIKKA